MVEALSVPKGMVAVRLERAPLEIRVAVKRAMLRRSLPATMADAVAASVDRMGVFLRPEHLEVVEPLH